MYVMHQIMNVMLWFSLGQALCVFWVGSQANVGFRLEKLFCASSFFNYSKKIRVKLNG